MLHLIALLFAWLIEGDSVQRKINRMDADPRYSIKSDKWKREHGIIK